MVGERSFDVAFVDLRLGTESGLDLLPRLAAAAPGLKLVVITAYASVETAVEAMRRGAADYLAKPFTPAQIDLTLEKVMALARLERHVQALEGDLAQADPEADLDERQPRHAAGSRSRPPGGAGGRPGPPPRRERHRQGGGGARHPRLEPAPRPAVRHRHLLGPPRRAVGKRALRPRPRGLHRRRPRQPRPGRRSPTGGPSCSTRSATSPSPSSPSSCASSRTASTNAWETPRPGGPTSASSPPPTRTWSARWPPGASARTSSTG